MWLQEFILIARGFVKMAIGRQRMKHFSSLFMDFTLMTTSNYAHIHCFISIRKLMCMLKLYGFLELEMEGMCDE